MGLIQEFLRNSLWLALTQSFFVVSLVAMTQQTANAAVSICGETHFDGPYTTLPDDKTFYVMDSGIDLGFGGPDRDLIRLEFYNNGLGASGTIDLSTPPNNNYSNCEVCLIVLVDLDAGSQAAKILFPSAGAINISNITPPGTALELDVSFIGLRVVEVTINGATFESTPVAGGSCYVPKSGIFRNGFEN